MLFLFVFANDTTPIMRKMKEVINNEKIWFKMHNSSSDRSYHNYYSVCCKEKKKQIITSKDYSKWV